MAAGTQVCPFAVWVEPTVTPSSFVPTDIAGCAAWFDADALTGLSDGDPVATWPNDGSGGDASQGTSGARPTYQTNELNGLPVVRFDGTDDTMAASVSVSQPINTFVVARTNASSTNQRKIIDGGYGNRAMLDENGGTWRLHAGGSDVLSGGTADDDYHLFAIVYSGASSSLRVDGKQVASGTLAADSLSTLYLGSTAGSVDFLDGDIAEVIIYDSVLSDADRTDVEDYLARKWFGRRLGTQVFPFAEWVEPGGGGLTISVADSIAISTTVSRIASSFRQVSDNLGLSDTVLRTVASFRTALDSVALSDSVTRSLTAHRLASDQIGVSDQAGRLVSAGRLLSDSVAVSDAASRVAQSRRLSSDNLAISTGESHVTQSRRLLTDFVAIGDSVTAVLVPVGVLTILVQDFIAVSTNEQHTTQARRLLTDLVGLTDSVLRAGASSRQVSDSVAVSDALSRVVQSVRFLADSVGVTDQVLRSSVAFRFLSDAVAIGDDVTATLVAAGVYLIQVLDSLGLSDTVSRAVNAFRIASDSIGLSDAATRTAAHWRAVADSIGVLDATNVQLIVFGTILVRITDTLALSDSVGTATQSFRVLVDFIGINDAFDLYIAVVIIGFVGFLSDPGGLGVLADTPGFGFLSGNS